MTPSQQTDQNANYTPPSRGRGRGRGDFIPNDARGGRGSRGGNYTRKSGPLSEQLYQERPFLRPITFVKSQLTPSLFMDEEEIFEPVVEAAGAYLCRLSYLFISACLKRRSHHIQCSSVL